MSELSSTVAVARSALFVPGDRPDRFRKAAASGADLVIVDWEDAVATTAKAEAVSKTLEALHADAGFRVLIRINAVDTPQHEGDLAALATAPRETVLGVMVPKAETAGMIRDVRESVPAGIAIIPLVETALGLVQVDDIAAAEVTRLAFGAIDFALDIGADSDDRYLSYARSRIVVASRAAQIAAPLDSPSPEFRDLAVVTRSAGEARGYGFGGKLCIHPDQVGPVTKAFGVSDEEIDWARHVIAQAGDGASAVDGKMVDRPVVERALRVLRTAGVVTGSDG